MHRVVEVVKDFLESHAVTGPGIVAVSGGADSVALLRAFCELNVPVTIAHMNYQLRGEESDGDDAYVQALAEQLGVPIQSTCVVLNPKDNLEEAARFERYLWFSKLQVRVGARWTATGHTKDDQAETVLHRLIRGSGLQGLCGILIEAWGQIRPLLKVDRSDVLDYLKEVNQSYRVDSSNNDLQFTRNRIRHQLLPLLRTFNPQIVSTLCKTAEQADEHLQYFRFQALNLAISAEKKRAGDLCIYDRGVLSDAEKILVRELMRQLWDREDWPRRDMTYEHWQRLADLTPGDYPGGIRLTLTDRVVQLGPRS